MQYVGLILFERELRKKMSERISRFVEHMGDKYAANPGLNQNKTKAQWIRDFKEWSDSQNMLESEILKYLRGD